MMNYNLATTSNYKLEIAGVPEINYFIQTAELPSITLPEVPVPYEDTMIYVPGDTLEFEPLQLAFLIDEDYANYIYIHQWIKRCRGSKDTEVFKDLTLHLLNNNKIVNKKIVFYYAFPTTLSSISYDSTQSDTISLVCPVVFRYQEYEFITS